MGAGSTGLPWFFSFLQGLCFAGCHRPQFSLPLLLSIYMQISDEVLDMVMVLHPRPLNDALNVPSQWLEAVGAWKVSNGFQLNPGKTR